MLFKKEWLMFTELSEIIFHNLLTTLGKREHKRVNWTAIHIYCMYIYIYVMPFNMELLFQLRCSGKTLLVSHVGFHALLRSCFGKPRGWFGFLRWLSFGNTWYIWKLLVGGTGEALLCSRWIRCSVMLRFGTVLDFFRWLVSRWASSGPARVGGRSCESRKR